MDGCLRLTIKISLIMAAMTIIPVLSESRSSSLDTNSGAAVRMVDKTSLSARAETREYYEGRYAAKKSSTHRWTQYPTREWWYGRDREVAVQHGRGLRRLLSGQDTNSSATLRVDVDGLIAFKDGISSDSLGALSSWNSNDSSACHWKGVTCATPTQRVVALDLGNLQLEGSITPLLGSLQYLQNVNLSDNLLSGEIPTSLVNCSNLSHLALANNNFSGHIPSQLGDFLQLQSLDLSNNTFLAGTFPSSLGNCSLLRLLLLNSTQITGEIPISMGQLAHLEILDLSGTGLSGEVPASLGNCSNLFHLGMGNYLESYNKQLLSGELPVELGSLSRLTYLAVIESNIGGHFPAWIANFTRLTYLSLTMNFFTGEIPDIFGQLPLESFDVGENNFTGVFPLSIINCSKMSSLIVETNSLSGSIPPEIALLTELQTISLTRNEFSGKFPSFANCSALENLLLGQLPLMEAQEFPSWLGSLVNIQLVYLAQTNMYGRLPADIGNLSPVVYLVIWGNNFIGPIPATIGNCTFLQLLDVDTNQLSGELPSEIWGLSELQGLNLADNLFTGTLPASIGNLSELTKITVDKNFFSGVIPQQIGSLQNLQTFSVAMNNLSDYIPPALGNASALFSVHLSNNQLVGPISSSLSNLSQLEELHLDNNRLEGSIPADLTRCRLLGDLTLSWNSLSGSIPQDIGQLTSLQSLMLNNNNLSGVLPDSLSSCVNMLYVDLSHNAFTGAIPASTLGGMSSGLISWNVSHNLLSGSLPLEVAQLVAVNYLDFSFNNFSGPIPPELEGCKSLLSLDLSVNGLSGSIPQSLVRLQYLTFFNVSDNGLEGPIPSGGIFATSNLTAASFFGNAGLCGNFVGTACPDLAPSRSVAAPSACKGFQCIGIRIAVACPAAGLVSAVLLFICWLRFYKRGKTDIIKRKRGVLSFRRGLNLSTHDLITIMGRPENKIGAGASSVVYKGVLQGGETVAIKALSIRVNDADCDYTQAEADLLSEAHILSKLRHRNILKVFGCFSSEDGVALVSEFMPNGSLNDHLYPSDADDKETMELNWDARLNIALGVAHGLVYLHNQLHEPVIHRDVKPSNIFLDADLEPKLGDFGISRFVNPDKDGEETASNFCGTFGYIPPEYGATMRVSTKGDVYSYGVMLLELLTGKHPILPEDLSASGEYQHLVEWVLESFGYEPLAIVDRSLVKESVEKENQRDQMTLLMRVGLLCTQPDPKNRPQMNDVVGMVNQIKERGADRLGRHPSLAELADKITAWDPFEGTFSSTTGNSCSSY